MRTSDALTSVFTGVDLPSWDATTVECAGIKHECAAVGCRSRGGAVRLALGTWSQAEELRCSSAIHSGEDEKS